MHPIDEAYRELLNDSSYEELRYRAAVVGDLSYTEPSFAQDSKTYRFGNATRYANNDSGGQSAIWYFTDDGKILLITFTHDCAANVGGSDYERQRSFYRGVPADLMRLAADRTPAYENLIVENPETGDSVLVATAVAWFDGAEWNISDGAAAFCEEEGFDPGEGTLTELDPYMLGETFTPETYIDDYFLYPGWPGSDRETLLEEIRPIFARHPRP